MGRRLRHPSTAVWVLAGLAWGAQLATLYVPDPRAVKWSARNPERTDRPFRTRVTEPRGADNDNGTVNAADTASEADEHDHDGIADAMLESMPRDTDKIVHAVVFAAGTAGLIAVGVPWYVAAAGQCAHGWVSEKLQAHIPGRGADSVDVLADAAGVALGTVLGAIAAR